VEKYARASQAKDGNIIRRMRIVCRIAKATNTQDLTLRLLMSYIYGAPILDVSRSHTTTHPSR